MQVPDKIYEIAALIEKDWKNIYFGAVPYIAAMHSLQSTKDSYGEDSAKTIIVYFLSNAKPWRGDVAKAVKAKLNAMCK